MRPVYSSKCFTRPQYSFGVRSLLAAEKALLIRNDLTGMLSRRPMPWLPQLMLSLTNGTNVWTKLDNMLKNKTLMFNIERGNINLLSVFVFLRSCAVYHLWIMIKKTGGENNTQIVCVLWTDDVTVMMSSSKNFCVCSKLNSIHNVYFGINGMVPFSNLFIKQPWFIAFVVFRIRPYVKSIFTLIFTTCTLNCS